MELNTGKLLILYFSNLFKNPPKRLEIDFEFYKSKLLIIHILIRENERNSKGQTWKQDRK